MGILNPTVKRQGLMRLKLTCGASERFDCKVVQFLGQPTVYPSFVSHGMIGISGNSRIYASDVNLIVYVPASRHDGSRQVE